MTSLSPNLFPAGERCGGCRFAGTAVTAGSDADKVLVRCQRFPPQRLGFERPYGSPFSNRELANQDTAWPVLMWDGWCGEYAPRHAAAEGEG